MTPETAFHALGLIFQVSLLDLVLSGDNAVVIALACRKLPARQVKQAMMIGTGAAVGLRVVLTAMVGLLLQVPMLKLLGAALLIVIAIRLLVEEEQGTSPAGDDAPSNLWGVVMTVLAADLVMSVDNVVALAAVSQGSALYLVLGLLLSVPLLMFGSGLMAHLIRRFPPLIPASGALLGYVAGDLAVSDPAIAEAVQAQSPALTVLVPLLCAVFVVMESRIIERRRAELPLPARRKLIQKSRVPAPAKAPTSIPQGNAGPSQAPLTPPWAGNAAAVSRVHSEAPAITTTRFVPLPLPEATTTAPQAAPALAETAAIARLRFRGMVPILVATAGTVLVVVLGYKFGGQVMPKPETDVAYVCPGGTATVYYRPGRSPIRIASANGDVTGQVDINNKISWNDPQTATDTLHFVPPDKIEDSDARTVTINGGSLSQTRCIQQQ